MKPYPLEMSERVSLKAVNRQTSERRYADRLKAVILLGSGWSAHDVVEVLLIDRDTVRKYDKQYQSGGTESLLTMYYQGSQCALTDEQLNVLEGCLQETLYQTTREILQYVKKPWDVTYTVSGVTALLHRLGYVYKKPKRVPGKADAQAQEAFLAEYEKLKENKAEGDPISFMDAVHPQHNPVLAYGWIKQGTERQIPSNTGRQRLNIHGVIGLSDWLPIIRFDGNIKRSG